MTKRTILAHRYAKALLFSALARKREQAVKYALHEITIIIQNQSKWLLVFKHPKIDILEKIRVFDTILEAIKTELDDSTRMILSGFMDVLIRKNRIELLPSIEESYEDQLDSYYNKEKVMIIGTQEISPVYKEHLEALLAKIIHKEIIARYDENHELLAGFQVRTKKLLIDISLAGSLQRWAKSFADSKMY